MLHRGVFDSREYTEAKGININLIGALGVFGKKVFKVDKEDVKEIIEKRKYMNQINKISALASKLLSKIGIDGMAHIIVCQNLVMWLSKYTPLWGSNHYNRRNLRSEGSIRQVLQENRVFN